jgi:hypothetical protein
VRARARRCTIAIGRVAPSTSKAASFAEPAVVGSVVAALGSKHRKAVLGREHHLSGALAEMSRLDQHVQHLKRLSDKGRYFQPKNKPEDVSIRSPGKREELIAQASALADKGKKQYKRFHDPKVSGDCFQSHEEVAKREELKSVDELVDKSKQIDESLVGKFNAPKEFDEEWPEEEYPLGRKPPVNVAEAFSTPKRNCCGGSWWVPRRLQ